MIQDENGLYASPRLEIFLELIRGAFRQRETGVCVEFPDLELVKIEPNHLVPGFDSLITLLEERLSSN